MSRSAQEERSYEVKALGKPPQRVKLVMESACVAFQVKPDRVRHPDTTGKRS